MATHRYAKRQRTWFRKDGRIRWIDASGSSLEALEREALEIIGYHEHHA